MHGVAKRKGERHSVEIDAVVRRSNGSREAVKLRDFSNDGCRIESASQFRIGERLQITIPRMGHIKAQVRWALAGTAGARFLAESDF
jgi:hypothetical protein